MATQFEWDEDKAQLNFKKRGIRFEQAALIFRSPVLIEKNDRHDYGEDRYVAIGLSRDRCYVVVYTPRGDGLRIITAWYGGRRDRSKYQAYLAGRADRPG